MPPSPTITSRLDKKGRLHLSNVPRHLVHELTTDRDDVVKVRVSHIQSDDPSVSRALFDLVLWLDDQQGAVARSVAVLDLVAHVHRVNVWQVLERSGDYL